MLLTPTFSAQLRRANVDEKKNLCEGSAKAYSITFDVKNKLNEYMEIVSKLLNLEGKNIISSMSKWST